MKTLLKILKWFGIITGSIIILLIISVYAMYSNKFEAPLPTIQASTDSSIIARGKYLAYGPMHCASCHVPMDKIADVEKGIEVPMTGGWELDIPPGTFRSVNLTPDMETGIGKMTDAQIARALRHGVAHDGRLLVAFMPFQKVSDEDLTALISYLRSQAPVKSNLKPTEYKFMGKALIAFGMLKPEGPKVTPPKTVIRDSSIAYGDYLVNNVANCKGCHTDRSMMTGEFTGPDLAGGHFFAPEAMSEGYGYIPPNLTPDKETGVMAEWTETAFINRFHQGRVYKTSPMPWGSFSRMDEIDIKAIYRYLKSVAPVKKKIEKTVFQPGDKMPG